MSLKELHFRLMSTVGHESMTIRRPLVMTAREKAALFYSLQRMVPAR